MLDVFRTDAFGLVQLTMAMQNLPYKPGRLGEMGLFSTKGINSTTVVIEEQSGKLHLLPTAARGTMPRFDAGRKRKARAFEVPHIPFNDAVMADEVQGVRAFGTEDQTETVAEIVNSKLETMRQSHEVTHEWHRIGSIQGKVLDADGISVLVDIFDEFGVVEPTTEWDFSASLRPQIQVLQRMLADALGAIPYTGIVGMCGAEFFDALVACEEIRETWLWLGNQQVTETQRQEGFVWGGIKWEEYYGHIGSQEFIPAAVCRFVLTGVPDLFLQQWAPANFIETVNTIGVPVYAKQKIMDFDTGVELHTQSNPFTMCTRPATLVKGTLK
jgi:hypothetical protein